MTDTSVSTEEAAEIIGVNRSRIQQLCRAFIATGAGLPCQKVGSGRHAVYIIRRADAEIYRSSDRKRGWPKGRKRASGYDAGPTEASAVSTKNAATA